MVFKFVNIN